MTEERKRFIFDSTRRIIEDLPDRPVIAKAGAESTTDQTALSDRVPTGPATVCGVPARDEADELVGMMLRQMLRGRGVAAELLSAETLKGEAMERIAQLEPESVCVSAVSPAAVLHASALCKRLRGSFPDIEIVVALWHAQGNIDRATSRLHAAGATKVVTTIEAAVAGLR